MNRSARLLEEVTLRDPPGEFLHRRNRDGAIPEHVDPAID